MATKWADIFAPVMAQGREVREGQAILGQAIIDAIENKTSLTAQAGTGTGKSFASLIPLIHQILKMKKAKKPYRAIVSTETLALQAQLIDKDLPFLSKLYPGFTYRKLMGRSNYLCFEVARTASVADMTMNQIVEKLKLRQSSLITGEKQDVEKVLGRELTTEQWNKIASSSQFCPDNQCSGEKCYSTRAREQAKAADLVVVNHAILAVDIEMKAGDVLGDGMLGQFEALIVDEGHQLEPAFVKAWTKEVTERELETMSASLIDGIDMAKGLKSNANIGKIVYDAMEDIKDVLSNTKRYYMLLNEKAGGKWDGSQTALSLKYPLGRPSGELARAMDEFEEENPQRLLRAEQALEQAIKYLGPVVVKAAEDKLKGIRKLRKGLTAAGSLLENVRIISKAFETKDGIISQYGTYGANVEGWETWKDKTPMMKITLTPLDVSARAQALWGKKGGQTNVLLSATLTDLTDGTFRYARECIAFPEGAEVDVNSPFDSREQQRVYVTPANRKDRYDGEQYSFSELMDLIHASRGRALVLFTSRKELDRAADQMQQMKNMGYFPYQLLVQTKDADKRKLKEEFERDISSVLLATKSFFVGIDIPGESLSLLALVKWPNERYDSLCKQMITHWRMRGFPRWYERISLTLFQQAAGRLIRSMGCKGVVALLDYRANDSESNVFKTAKMGVDTLKSYVTQDIGAVKEFLK